MSELFSALAILISIASLTLSWVTYQRERKNHDG